MDRYLLHLAVGFMSSCVITLLAAFTLRYGLALLAVTSSWSAVPSLLFNEGVWCLTSLFVFYLVLPSNKWTGFSLVIPALGCLLVLVEMALLSRTGWSPFLGSFFFLWQDISPSAVLPMMTGGSLLCSGLLAPRSPASAGEDFTLFREAYLRVMGRPLEASDSQLSAIVGFFEGDGTGWTALMAAARQRTTLSITQEENAVLYHLQAVLGFGNVYLDAGGKASKWSVDSQAHVSLFITLLNGNLRLPLRLIQLEKVIAGFNRMVAVRGLMAPITFIDRVVPVSLTTGWFSGFFDAEGCLYIGISPEKFTADASVSQTGAANLPVLQRIGVLFGGTLILRNPLTNHWNVGVRSFGRSEPDCPLFAYFTVFPLMTVKAATLETFKVLIWMKQSGAINSRDLDFRFQAWVAAAQMNSVGYKKRMKSFYRWELALGRDLPRAPGF